MFQVVGDNYSKVLFTCCVFQFNTYCRYKHRVYVGRIFGADLNHLRLKLVLSFISNWSVYGTNVFLFRYVWTRINTRNHLSVIYLGIICKRSEWYQSNRLPISTTVRPQYRALWKEHHLILRPIRKHTLQFFKDHYFW